MELDAERDSTPTESIEESIERQELFQEVEKLIDQQLSPVQRLILRKKEYEDESIEKIAKELDMQQAAVRMQLSRARKIIRECYRNRHNHEE
jgi:RNA polymerase sigma-70 factor (ECF subfamily)